MATATETRFDYVYSPINDLHVETEQCEETGKEVVAHVLVQDEPIQASQRFWTSLFSRFGFNKAVFKYFSHKETFDRISLTESSDRMRLCIERGTDGKGEPTSTLMAVSNPTKPFVVYEELMETLSRYQGQGVSYSNGIVESTHNPRGGAGRFEILGDDHENRFVMATPIDGYGSPNLYLALLRLVCQNGMVGYAKAFRSSLALGKANDDVTPSITRALDGFNNDEGFAAIRQRIESAGNSWSSVYESQTLYKLIVKLHANDQLNVNDGHVAKGTDIAKLLAAGATADNGGLGSPILNAFHRMTGDPCETYGLANLDALSAKRQRTLPVKCRVYDQLNFATEVATHYAKPAGARQLQAWVGTHISEDEYDMEGTCTKFADFADFLVDAKMESGLTGSQHAPDRN